MDVSVGWSPANAWKERTPMSHRILSIFGTESYPVLWEVVDAKGLCSSFLFCLLPVWNGCELCGQCFGLDSCMGWHWSAYCLFFFLISPKNSILSGCGSGWDMKRWFYIALPGYSLPFLSFFFASLVLVPLILLPTPNPFITCFPGSCLVSQH